MKKFLFLLSMILIYVAVACKKETPTNALVADSENSAEDSVEQKNEAELLRIMQGEGYYVRDDISRDNTDNILTLRVTNPQKISVQAIDIVAGETIVRHEWFFTPNNETGLLSYTSRDVSVNLNRGEVSLYRNGNFSYAGAFGISLPEAVKQRTTDYLLSYTGEYIFDSYDLILQDKVQFPVDEIKETVIRVVFDTATNTLYAYSNSFGWYPKRAGTQNGSYFLSYGADTWNPQYVRLQDGYLCFYYGADGGPDSWNAWFDFTDTNSIREKFSFQTGAPPGFETEFGYELSAEKLDEIIASYTSNLQYTAFFRRTSPKTGIIKDTGVRLRDNPNLESNVIASLDAGISVDILWKSDTIQTIDEREAYWYYVRTTKASAGWVYGAYVDIVDE